MIRAGGTQGPFPCVPFAYQYAAAFRSFKGTPQLQQDERAASPGARVLYDTHIPLNPVQKVAVALLGAVGAAIRPARADLVAAVGETTGLWAIRQMRDRMLASETGRAVLQDRPRVTDDTLRACRAMPPHSFGAAYADFMGARGFQADERPPVRFVDDIELAYVVQRYREVHDFWHVLFDCHTNVFGELALKALEFVQTGMPMPALAVAGAQWRLSASDRALLQREFLPWALRAGSRSTDLMTLYYEKHLQDDLDDLRARWRILPAPQPPQRLQLRKKAEHKEMQPEQLPAERQHDKA